MSKTPNNSANSKIRLNKYIAHCGFCSRRDADNYIAAGKVSVNGETISEMGVKVKKSDCIEVEGQELRLEGFVYFLLNKPKNTITTTDDPRGRKTVMDQIEDATEKRVYPVGRLDRNTTGLLLLTNDGDLANRLMHPRYKVKKTYEVQTQRKLRQSELQQLLNGIQLDDGPTRVYRISSTKDGIILTIFEGRNRLVRRMMEHFGTEVTKLKRIKYAGLTLKNVRIGRWRYLRENEINNLRKFAKLQPLNFNN